MKNKNYFWGIIFILVAVSILLRNFYFFPAIHSSRLLITILLVYFIAKNITYRNFFGILLPAAFIYLLYDEYLPFTFLSPFSILAAAVFGSIGLTFLFPSHTSYKPDFSFSPEMGEGSYNNQSDVSCSVTFAGCTKYFESDDFRRAYLKCSFGALKAYFDHAKITGSSAEIYVENSFGETNLFLPKEWDVHADATSTFGNITEIHKPSIIPSGAPTVLIHGNVSFGDCKIFYI